MNWKEEHRLSIEKLNRRCVLQAAAGALAAMTSHAIAAAGPPLSKIAAGSGLRFGSALGMRGFADAGYRQLIADECAVLVCENEMKWRMLRRSLRRYSFDRADKIVEFARDSGLAMRGHTLLFHRALNNVWDEQVKTIGAERAIRDHIAAVCRHFGDTIVSWDVVNEPVDPNGGRPDRLRASPYLAELGPDYIDLAFHTARQAAPHATLVLNDWVAPYRPEFFRNHRSSMLQLLERLKGKGVPVDALGIQGHLVASRPDFDEREWSRFIDEVAAMNLRILITEFDVADDGLPADASRRDAAVASHAKAFLDLTLANEAVTDVLTWGLSDAYSAVHSGHARRDGLPNRSLPYDELLVPKPLRSAIAQALAAAPKRNTIQGKRGA
jgi:endo-1,4-beta-xylanase